MYAPLPANYIRTTLDGDITDTDLTMTVSSVSGWPTITNDDYFYLVLVRATDATKEIVKVTAFDATTKVATIERAADGTIANTFCDGDRVEMWVTRALLLELAALPNLTLGTPSVVSNTATISIQVNDHPDNLTYTSLRMWLIDDNTNPNDVTLSVPTGGDTSVEWTVITDSSGAYSHSITHTGSSTTWYLAIEVDGRVYITDAITLGS